MRVFISSLNVPIGYVTPDFPLLYWPLGATRSSYSAAILYYPRDVWRFTMLWSVVFFASLYVISGLIAIIHMLLSYYRSPQTGKVNIVVSTVFLAGAFVVNGVFLGFVSGSVVGLLLGAIYSAGSMTMSTWIPFSWGIICVLYDICTSYSTSTITL